MAIGSWSLWFWKETTPSQEDNANRVEEEEEEIEFPARVAWYLAYAIIALAFYIFSSPYTGLVYNMTLFLLQRKKKKKESNPKINARVNLFLLCKLLTIDPPFFTLSQQRTTKSMEYINLCYYGAASLACLCCNVSLTVVTPVKL